MQEAETVLAVLREGCVFLKSVNLRLSLGESSVTGVSVFFGSFRALPGVIVAGQLGCWWFAGRAGGRRPRRRVRRFRGRFRNPEAE